MAMTDLENVMKSLEFVPLQVKSECLVDVIHIVDPHQFYTRLLKHKAAVKKIEDCKPTSRPLSVNKGDKILFDLCDSNETKFARGVVTLVNRNEDEVLFDISAIDYGYMKSNVCLNRIWMCDKSILAIPPLAIRCRLANCAPRNKDGSWGTAVQAFKESVAGEYAKLIVQEVTKTDFVVILYNSMPDDISTLLTLTDFTTYGYVHKPLDS